MLTRRLLLASSVLAACAMLAANAGDGGSAAALTAQRTAATDRDDGRPLHELTVNVMGADHAAWPTI